MSNITLSSSLSVEALASGLTGSREFAMSHKADKNGNIKTGNLAHAFAFATGEARKDISRAMYANWLANGTYRPLVRAIVAQLPKSAQSFAQALVGSGPVSKEVFISTCRAIVNMIDESGKEPKGQKAFYYGLCKAVINEANRSDDIIEA